MICFHCPLSFFLVSDFFCLIFFLLLCLVFSSIYSLLLSQLPPAQSFSLIFSGCLTRLFSFFHLHSSVSLLFLHVLLSFLLFFPSFLVSLTFMFNSVHCLLLQMHRLDWSNRITCDGFTLIQLVGVLLICSTRLQKLCQFECLFFVFFRLKFYKNERY